MIYVEWNFELSSLKSKIFKILTLRGPGAAKRGTQTQKFLLIWFLVYVINFVWNFEHSSIKNKILKFWHFGARAAQTGPPKQKI